MSKKEKSVQALGAEYDRLKRRCEEVAAKRNRMRPEITKRVEASLDKEGGNLTDLMAEKLRAFNAWNAAKDAEHKAFKAASPIKGPTDAAGGDRPPPPPPEARPPTPEAAAPGKPASKPEKHTTDPILPTSHS